MTLYNHVPNKDALLDGICERVLDDLKLDECAPGNWEEQLRSHARAFRFTALRHPRAFPLMLIRQLASPLALRPVDTALATLRSRGARIRRCRARPTRVPGVPDRMHPPRLGASPNFSGLSEDGAASRRAQLAASGLPRVAAAADPLAQCAHGDEYSYGIELLIARLRSTLDTGSERGYSVT